MLAMSLSGRSLNFSTYREEAPPSGSRADLPIDQSRDRVLEIIFPEAGKVRSRTVVSRSRHRSTGKFPSWKMGRMMQCESLPERNAFRLLDACPAVTAYYEQPLIVRYVMDGILHTHYPDLLVEIGCRRELWEIKPFRAAIEPETAARTRLLESTLPAHGFTYHMVTAEELAREPRLSTAIELLKHGRRPVSETEREHTRQLFLAASHITWAAANGGDLGPRGRAVLSRLALEGVLVFDGEQPLTSFTKFSWCPSAEEVVQ